jgi:hypothetical protein
VPPIPSKQNPTTQPSSKRRKQSPGAVLAGNCSIEQCQVPRRRQLRINFSDLPCDGYPIKFSHRSHSRWHVHRFRLQVVELSSLWVVYPAILSVQRPTNRPQYILGVGATLVGENQTLRYLSGSCTVRGQRHKVSGIQGILTLGALPDTNLGHALAISAYNSRQCSLN